MAFDINKTLGDMLDAVSGIVSDGWPDIKSCIERALRDEKESLRDIVTAYEAGDLSEEDLESQLADEKLVIESAMLACRVKTKVMAQNAANAAIDALTAAIKLAI